MRTYYAVLSIFVLVTAGQEEEASCPVGWIQYETDCYIYQPEKQTFDNAVAGCSGLGGRLAEPENTCQNQLLVLLAEQNSDTGIYGPWFGVRNSTNGFQYVSNNQPVKFTDWAPGEPNNGEGDEDCVHFWEKRWNDIQCRWLNSYFCQKDAIQ